MAGKGGGMELGIIRFPNDKVPKNEGSSYADWSSQFPTRMSYKRGWIVHLIGFKIGYIIVAQ